MMGLDLLADMRSPSYRSDRIQGVVVGVVTNNNDLEGLGRVKVRFPWLSDTDESNWARVASPMAGKDRGLWLPLQVDDEVLVMFEHGMVDRPFVIGALWNGKDTPPAEVKERERNMRVLKSKNGHTVTLDDTADEERIVVSDKAKKNVIVIDIAKKKISITSEDALAIEAGGDISLKAKGALAVECQKFTVDAGDGYELAGKKGKVEADDGLGITCMKGVKINVDALEVK